MKSQDMDPNESGANNPYRVLMQKLTGASIQRPRLRSPTNVWRKTQRATIDEVVKRHDVPRAQQAKLRDKVAHEMFDKLPKEEQDQWAEQAKEEHEAAVEAWKKETQGAPSTEPADRQRLFFSPFFQRVRANFIKGVSKALSASANRSLT